MEDGMDKLVAITTCSTYRPRSHERVAQSWGEQVPSGPEGNGQRRAKVITTVIFRSRWLGRTKYCGAGG